MAAQNTGHSVVGRKISQPIQARLKSWFIQMESGTKQTISASECPSLVNNDKQLGGVGKGCLICAALGVVDTTVLSIDSEEKLEKKIPA